MESVWSDLWSRLLWSFPLFKTGSAFKDCYVYDWYFNGGSYQVFTNWTIRCSFLFIKESLSFWTCRNLDLLSILPWLFNLIFSDGSDLIYFRTYASLSSQWWCFVLWWLSILRTVTWCCGISFQQTWHEWILCQLMCYLKNITTLYWVVYLCPVFKRNKESRPVYCWKKLREWIHSDCWRCKCVTVYNLFWEQPSKWCSSRCLPLWWNLQAWLWCWQIKKHKLDDLQIETRDHRFLARLRNVTANCRSQRVRSLWKADHKLACHLLLLTYPNLCC